MSPRTCSRHYSGKPLVDKYDIYQHLMDYWSEVMQDDCYLIAAVWLGLPRPTASSRRARTARRRTRAGPATLSRKEYVVARFFADDQAKIDGLASELEVVEIAEDRS